ncbi:MAG: DNA gyrase inhibitor YacG [Methylococcales bacterium]|nr:DNA gyrase inhibitor YacG [Methylococcales bacterium]
MKNADSITVVYCPCCKKPVRWVATEKFKPFCCERCKLIDLGDWATEAHKIPGEAIPEPEDDQSF